MSVFAQIANRARELGFKNVTIRPDGVYGLHPSYDSSWYEDHGLDFEHLVDLIPENILYSTRSVQSSPVNLIQSVISDIYEMAGEYAVEGNVVAHSIVKKVAERVEKRLFENLA